MGKLDGRTALVTGGGRGIGLSIVTRLAAEGARVVVNDLDEGPAAAAVEHVRSLGGEAVACVGNVTDQRFPERFLATALDAFGSADIVVNNAGYVWNGLYDTLTDEQWDAMQQVHLKAPFRILRAWHRWLAPRVAEERQRGRRVMRKVVNVSSVSATGGSAGQAAYSAAKAGLLGLTRSLAKEWGRLDVNVNCVAFGLIDTRLTQTIDQVTTIDIDGEARRVGIRRQARDAVIQQIALARSGSPDEAAGGVALLCYPESDYITGQVLQICGGMST
ncbi:MAG: SDR family oxidoreductase [Burkholderiaceae bacterium]